MQPRHRLIKKHEIKKKSNQFTGGHIFTHDGQAANPEHRHNAQRGEEAHGRIVIGPRAHDAQRALPHRLGAVGEAVILMGLPTEGLDLADALQVVHQQRIHRAGRLTLAAVAAVGGERVPQRADGQQRQRCQCHGGEGYVGREENDADTDDGQHRHDALLGAVDEHALDAVDVLNDARHQVAGGAFVEISQRQPLQPAKDIAAHVVNNVLLEVIVDADAEAVEQVAQKKRPRKRQHRPAQAALVFVDDDVVNDIFRELWESKCEGERKHGAADGGQREPLVRAQVHPRAPEDFPGRTLARGERRVAARRGVVSVVVMRHARRRIRAQG